MLQIGQALTSYSHGYVEQFFTHIVYAVNDIYGATALHGGQTSPCTPFGTNPLSYPSVVSLFFPPLYLVPNLSPTRSGRQS